MTFRIGFVLACCVGACYPTVAQDFGQLYQQSFNNAWQNHHSGIQQQMQRAQMQAQQRRIAGAQRMAEKRQANLIKKAQKESQQELARQEMAYRQHLERMKKDPEYAAEVKRRELQGLVITGLVGAAIIGTLSVDAWQWESKDEGAIPFGSLYGSEQDPDVVRQKMKVWGLETEIRNATSDDQKLRLQGELDAVK